MFNRLQLDHDDALAALDAVRAGLGADPAGVVIAVVDAHGEILTLLRTRGAPLSSIGVATNKAFSAARLRRPSGETGRRSRHPETGFDISYYGDPRYLGWGGGLPIRIGDEVVGAVAVSGLTDVEDEALARLGVEAVLRRNPLPAL